MRRATAVSGAGRVLAAALALAALAAVPQTHSSFYLGLAFNVLIFALLAMSADLLGGYTGLFSLAHASLFACAAYGVAIAQQHGYGPWPSIALGVAASVVIAAAVAPIAIRVDGLAFVMVTLAIGQIIWGLAFRWTSLTGGENGAIITARPSLAGHSLTDNRTMYWVVLGAVTLLAAILRLIVASPFGLALKGIRENEPRMRSLGYRTTLHKYLAFVLSAFFAACAGIIFALYDMFISPTALDFLHNGFVLVMVVFGGIGTLWGALIGATFIELSQQWLSLYVARWQTIVGVALILIILFAPGGVLGIWTHVVGRLGRGIRREDQTPPTALSADQAAKP